MKGTVRVFAVSAFVIIAPSLAARPGSICVSPVTDEIRAMDRGDPTGKRTTPYQYKFSVQIDSGKLVPVGAKDGVLIPQLDTKKRHLVRIRDGEQLIQSFYFTFKDRGASYLCLSYGPWYQTWQLSPPGKRPWCRCK